MGAVNLTRTFLPLIRKTQGKVINIGSISGRITSPFLTSYSSSKFALRAISDGLRRELKSLGASVVLIEPGPIATDIWNTSMQNSLAMIGNAAPEVVDVYSENIKKLETDIQNIAKSTVTVDYLITFIDEAANSLHPKPYYKVGKNIGLVFALSHLLPARILDGLLTGGLRFKKLK
jgi:short-subunit dehydrogenase